MKLQEAEGILMALVAQADHKVRSEEASTAERILYRDGDDEAHAHWEEALLHTDEAEAAIIVLGSEPEAKRVQFIADLWEVAVSDFEVSRSENNVIFTIAHKLGVPAYPKGATPLPIAEPGTDQPASALATPETAGEKKQLIPGPFSTPVFLAIAAAMLFFFFFFERIWTALT